MTITEYTVHLQSVMRRLMIQPADSGEGAHPKFLVPTVCHIQERRVLGSPTVLLFRPQSIPLLIFLLIAEGQ